MATEAIYTKSLGGAEDLLLDASNSATVIQTRAGKDLEITKINSSTIPYSGKFGDPSMVSIKDQLDINSTAIISIKYQVDTNLVSSAYVIDTIEDLITVPSVIDTVIVKDINRGGIFVAKTEIDIDQNTGSVYIVNGGTVFAKLGGGFWVRQYDGVVNVKWFGAIGDGVTDDTSIFLSALNVTDSLFVPEGKFKIKKLNIPRYGIKILGVGTIVTGSGAEINLNTTNLEYSNTSVNLMFIESDNQGWEEFLHIKSLGYNYVMCYRWHVTVQQSSKNYEAVGMLAYVHTAYSLTELPNAIVNNIQNSIVIDMKDRYSTRGFYVFDEPFTNGATESNVDEVLAYVKLTTDKPLVITEQQVVFAGRNVPNLDVLLIDVYFHTSNNIDKNIGLFLHNIAEFKSANKNLNIIPTLGLFNDSTFSASVDDTTKLATILMRTNHNYDFGVFTWNAGSEESLYWEDSVRSGTYLNVAKELIESNRSLPRFNISIVGFGNKYSASEKDCSALLNPVESVASTGVVNAQTLIPWEVINAGSALDVRRQPWAYKGLGIGAKNASCSIAVPCSGLMSGTALLKNNYDSSSVGIKFGTTSDAGYSVNVGSIDTTLLNNTNKAFIGEYISNTIVDKNPVLVVTSTVDQAVEYSGIKCIFAFSDIPTQL